MIILDIAFEDTKEFQVELVTPGPGVNISPYALSRIVILDYNGECQEVTGEIEGYCGNVPLHAVIVQQQPNNIFDGLKNLINTTLPDDFTCVITSTTLNLDAMDGDSNGGTAEYNDTVDYDRIECSQHNTTISLTIFPCAKSIMLTVDDEGITILNEVLTSMPLSQTLTTEGDMIHFNVSLEVVSSNGSEYFIITLNSSVQLDFPMTAIPINCSEGNTL